jgi:uncharacterized protein YkwD
MSSGVVSALCMMLALDTATAPASAAGRAAPSNSGYTVYQGTCAGQDATVIKARVKAAEATLVCLINDQRSRWGLPRFSEAPVLNRVAQSWTDDMTRKNFFNNGDFQSRVTTAPYRWNAAGENIGTGFATPAEVLEAWMASDRHCRDVLSPYLSQVGTGLVARGVAAVKSHYATWTQVYGNPIDRSYPTTRTAPADGCPYKVTVR